MTGPARLLLMTADKAEALGLEPRARIVDTCIQGSDPVLMLTGPIPATEHLLERNKLTIDDIDLVEINEAFASVVSGGSVPPGPTWTASTRTGAPSRWGTHSVAPARSCSPRRSTSCARSGKQRALVTMCCGGGLGTGTIVERV